MWPFTKIDLSTTLVFLRCQFAARATSDWRAEEGLKMAAPGRARRYLNMHDDTDRRSYSERPCRTAFVGIVPLHTADLEVLTVLN